MRRVRDSDYSLTGKLDVREAAKRLHTEAEESFSADDLPFDDAEEGDYVVE